MALRFFITRPLTEGASAKKSTSAKVYGYSDDDGLPCKKMPDVVLLGGMTQSYCKSLAVVIYQQEGVRLRVPTDFEHPGFHGDEITLPYADFIKHLEGMIGSLDHLPKGAVVSMGALFDYLKEKIPPQKDDKNPPTPH